MRVWSWIATGMGMAAVAVSAIVVAPVQAQTEVLQFGELRGAIINNAPLTYQRAFLERVAVAERQLPPNPCVSLNVLTALNTQVQAVAGRNDFSQSSADVISSAIALTEATYLPPNPCKVQG